MGKLFGTDGIRGVANVDLTPELAFKVGRAASYILGKENKGQVIVGKDTRRSGDMLEAALVAGICSMGLDVLSLGVIPTPAVAYLTRKYNALAGIVISASHNPGEDNGIKIFNGKGLKLSDDIEGKIEEIILEGKDLGYRNKGNDIGRHFKAKKPYEDYKNYLKSNINIDLTGIKVAMDCGHGALYKIGPELIRELNGEVFVVNDNPDGMNINAHCGSTNPNIIQQLVLDTNSHIGISFDGDGDRIIAVDEKGKLLNGDHILAISAGYLQDIGKLKNNTVVGTVMTNIGLDLYLKEKGIKIVKTNVGDRYVLEEMINSEFVLGGEQSGHIIYLANNTTGDGLATGLHLLEIMINTGRTMSELNNVMIDYPQVLINAKVDESLKHRYLENEIIANRIKEIENKFHGEGRVVIRPSGTEPLVRVMIEGKDQEEITRIAKDLAELIEEKLI